VAKHPKHSADWDEQEPAEPPAEPPSPLDKIVDEPPPGMVRVKCITHAQPFTHEKPLEFGEEADVPADVADKLRELGYVE
jgi:hypothetical protein